MLKVVHDQGKPCNFLALIHIKSCIHNWCIYFLFSYLFLCSISDLYKWRYKSLGDLSHVKTEREYQLANPGFEFEYQLINVENYNGVGESEPSPYFFQVSTGLHELGTGSHNTCRIQLFMFYWYLQNLAEAEYVVGTFMYMRLMGYPADKITILTTYNGQKALIRDVINTRCGNNPFIGFPHKVRHTSSVVTNFSVGKTLAICIFWITDCHGGQVSGAAK
jgi:hypothetical protein